MKKNTPGLSGLSFNYSEELLRSPPTGTSPYLARAHLSSPPNQTQVSLSSTLRPPSPFDFSTTLPSTDRRSTPASQYLSPPLLSSDEECPPYLPGPDDLVSLDLHTPRKYRGSRRANCSCSSTGELKQVLPSRPDLATKKSTRITSNFACGREEGMASVDIEDTTVFGSPTSHNIPTNGNLFTSCKSLTPKDLPYSEVPDLSATRNHEVPEKRDRRLSPSSSSITAVPESLVVKHSAPIQSQAHTCARGYPGSFKPGNKIHDLPVPSWIKDSEGQTSPFRTNYQCQHSTHDRRHDTPASITLRKASEQYGRDLGKRRSLQSPAYSEGMIGFPILPQRLDRDMGSCDITSSPSFGRFCPFAMPLDAVPGSDPRASKKVSFQLSGLAHEANAEGQRDGTGGASIAAELHNPSRAFSFPRTSRTSYGLAIDTMQPSLVQIHSAGSVHRVIWAPDDTPSSSTSQTTSGPNGQLSRSGSSTDVMSCGSIRPGMSPSRQDVTRPQSSQLPLSARTHTTKPPSLQALAGMLEWDRFVEGHHKEIAIAPPLLVADQTPPIGRRLSRKTQPGRWSKKWKARLDYEAGVIESFPPLLARLSSEQWQTKRPVDLDDLTHGSSGLTLEDNEDFAPLESGDTMKRGVEAYPAKLDASEMLRHSKFGTAMGSSSHARRPSALQQQQTTYQCVMELTNTLSRKASGIRQSLSGQYSGAGRTGSEDKSAP